MDEGLERLSYRALAARLHISADAARMKARRKAQAGLWRIVAGPAPGDPVTVELPASDLAPARRNVRGERRVAERRKRSPSRQPAAQGAALVGQLLARLAEAEERIAHLTEQLLASKDAHRRDVMALAAAELRERAVGEVMTLRRVVARQDPWFRRILR